MFGSLVALLDVDARNLPRHGAGGVVWDFLRARTQRLVVGVDGPEIVLMREDGAVHVNPTLP
jgi:hypothetical protein